MAKTIWARIIDWLEDKLPTERNSRADLMEDLARTYRDNEKLRKDLKDAQTRQKATRDWELQEAKDDAARYKKWWVEKERECRGLRAELTELTMTPEERAERDRRIEAERQAKEQGRLDAIRRNEAAKHLSHEAKRHPVAPTAAPSRLAPPSSNQMGGSRTGFMFDHVPAMSGTPHAELDQGQRMVLGLDPVFDATANDAARQAEDAGQAAGASFWETPEAPAEDVGQAAGGSFWGSDPTPASDVGQAAGADFAFSAPEPSPSYSSPDPSPSYSSDPSPSYSSDPSPSYDSGSSFSSSSFDSGSASGGSFD